MASYIEETLEEGEKIVYKGRLHWTFQFRYTFIGSLAFLIGVAGMVYALIIDDGPFTDSMKALAIVMMLIAIIGFALILWGYFIRSKTEFAITDSRFIQKDGILNVNLMEIPLFKIETINFSQSFLERIWGTGSIQLVGSGGTDHTVKFLQHPHQVRKIIMERIKG